MKIEVKVENKLEVIRKTLYSWIFRKELWLVFENPNIIDNRKEALKDDR